MYTAEDGEQRVGLYSLEMAADLELDPKQYHVIAFEHAGDCKNLCYIIQAKMEELGNGNAFVVARPPKVIHKLMLLHLFLFDHIVLVAWEKISTNFIDVHRNGANVV